MYNVESHILTLKYHTSVNRSAKDILASCVWIFAEGCKGNDRDAEETTHEGITDMDSVTEHDTSMGQIGAVGEMH